VPRRVLGSSDEFADLWHRGRVESPTPNTLPPSAAANERFTDYRRQAQHSALTALHGGHEQLSQSSAADLDDAPLQRQVSPGVRPEWHTTLTVAEPEDEMIEYLDNCLDQLRREAMTNPCHAQMLDTPSPIQSFRILHRNSERMKHAVLNIEEESCEGVLGLLRHKEELLLRRGQQIFGDKHRAPCEGWYSLKTQQFTTEMRQARLAGGW